MRTRCSIFTPPGAWNLHKFGHCCMQCRSLGNLVLQLRDGSGLCSSLSYTCTLRGDWSAIWMIHLGHGFCLFSIAPCGFKTALYHRLPVLWRFHFWRMRQLAVLVVVLLVVRGQATERAPISVGEQHLRGQVIDNGRAAGLLPGSPRQTSGLLFRSRSAASASASASFSAACCSATLSKRFSASCSKSCCL